VTELGVAHAGTLDDLANLLNVVDEDLGAGTGVLTSLLANGRVTVQILRTDGDAGNQAIELVAVLVDGLLESSELVVEVCLTGGSPKTEEDAGLGLDSGRNGGNGLIVGVTLL
jgi:hypothetical protein